MPKFYINFRNGNDVVQDENGIDVSDIDQARAAAVTSLRDLLAEGAKANHPNPVSAAIITNESGKDLMTVRVDEVLSDTDKS